MPHNERFFVGGKITSFLVTMFIGTGLIFLGVIIVKLHGQDHFPFPENMGIALIIFGIAFDLLALPLSYIWRKKRDYGPV